MAPWRPPPSDPHPDDGFPTAQADLARAARLLVVVLACFALVLFASVAAVIASILW